MIAAVDRATTRRGILRTAIWPLLALVWAFGSVLIYAATARLVTGEWAYPLDDAWIHQTLARSFAQSGTFAVNPGEPVAGSTAPLWTLLIAAGYALGVPVYAWTMALGAVCFAGVLLGVRTLGNALFPNAPMVAAGAALVTALEWRHAWAAASGMETELFVLLSLVLLRLGVQDDVPTPWLGLVGALAVLARPEGSVLFAAALALRLVHLPDWRTRLRRGGQTLTIAAIIASPMLVYHVLIVGSPLPATFFAKTAFYREPLSVALGRYVRDVAQFFMLGPLLALVPPALLALPQTLRARRWPSAGHVLALGWLVALPLMYLVWLPYLYHHGRYLFPVLPVAALYAVAGTVQVVEGFRRWFQLLPRLVTSITVAVGLTLWANGIAVFAANAQTILSLQVATARWLAATTPATARVATHDIGAVGYFAGRRIVDMAGLVTPALTASPRDRERILEVLRAERVQYVAILSEWYPWFPPSELPAVEVFHTGAQMNGREFHVYRVEWPP